AADYTQGPPTFNDSLHSRGSSGPVAFAPRTGVLYQQRLVMPHNGALEVSRTGYPNNFTRDYPLSNSSSFTMTMGSQYVDVLRLIESDGLVAFTNVGVWLHGGAITTTNAALAKKGDWLIDYRVPPIAIPGGVLF